MLATPFFLNLNLLQAVSSAIIYLPYKIFYGNNQKRLAKYKCIPRKDFLESKHKGREILSVTGL
jgi:hypothetical protein